MTTTPDRADFVARYHSAAPQLVWTELVADLETPVSAMLKLARDKRFSFLLESVEGGAVRGRYSVIGLDPDLIWRCHGQAAEIKDRVEQTCGDCELRDRCQSHCGCRHLALSGKLGEVTAALCETETAFIEAADRVAETLYEEQCETFIDFYYKRPWDPSPGARLSQLRLSRDG